MPLIAIDEYVKKAIADGVFPGCVVLASQNKRIRHYEAYGQANIYSGKKMTRDTVFDLASLTKPLATTLAVMKLVQAGLLRIDQTIGSVMPEFSTTDKNLISIRQLLCHRSGLPAHREYFHSLKGIPFEKRKRRLRELLVLEPLEHPIGRNVVYSDLGFMILEWIVENVSGERLDRFVTKEIYAPLDLTNLFFVDLLNPANRQFEKEFAATEYCDWRKKLLIGEVHDDNTYVSGGVGGHAGLFGTASDVHTLLIELIMAYAGYSKYNLFDQYFLRLFMAECNDTGRALGFDKPSQDRSSCGRYFSENTVGHLGFTGVSFWVDLNKCIVIIILTNRVHPTRNNHKIKLFRPEMHNILMEHILSL